MQKTHQANSILTCLNLNLLDLFMVSQYDYTEFACGIHSATTLLLLIVHLNIIFSYMKFNKICNLDHPVY